VRSLVCVTVVTCGLAAASQLLFDNTIPGGGQSSAVAVALDAQGNVLVAGNTNSQNPAFPGGVQTRPGNSVLFEGAAGGINWTSLSLGGATVVNWIAAAPSVPSRLYAATDRGVFTSSDGGSTWTAAGSQGLLGPAQVLAVDAGSPTTVYAAERSGFYVSTDGAATFTSAVNGIGPLVAIPQAPTAIFANPALPGMVFAMTQNPWALYRSTDGAKTWTALTVPDPFQGTPAAMAFVPSAPQTLFLGQEGGPVLKSTDNGNTWAVAMAQSVADNQALAVDPTNPSTIYVANAAGLLKSSDGGQTYAPVLPAGLPSPGPQSVFLDPNNSSAVYVVGATGLFRSGDAGATWNKLPLPYTPNPTALFVGADSRVFVGTSSQGDVFVTKWTPDGSQLIYTTYLGGSGTDTVTGMALDSAGSVYLTGMTTSPDFPVTAGAVQKALAGHDNAFIAKISADGSKLLYSTFLGGGSEYPGRIAVDANGSAVVTGQTGGNFPVTPGAYETSPPVGCTAPYFGLNYPVSGDAYVAKLAPDGGSLVYATLLGGSCGNLGHAVALDSSGNAWVIGMTSSPDFPVTTDALQPKYGGGFSDGFVTRFDPQGRLLYSTFLGGPSYDEIYDLTLDPAGNVYLTGSTTSFSQAASPGAFQPQPAPTCLVLGIGPPMYYNEGNAFVMKLDPAGHSVTGLTYLGAPCTQYAQTIAVDRTGSPWIGGFPSASQFPTAAPFQIGIGNGFVSRFSPDLTQLLFSTYFDAVNDLTVDASGTAYVVGGNPSQQAYVAHIDPAPPPVELDSVVGYPQMPAIPGDYEGLAPGKVMTVVGRNLGPATATSGVVASGAVTTTVAGVTVTFDGVAAPLLSVAANAIQIVTPFELPTAGNTTVQVTVNSVKSNAVLMPVNAVAPEVLAVMNGDFTLNSASNPAAAGSIMTIYASGLGQTNPPSTDGQVTFPPLAQTGVPVSVGLTDDYTVTYAGAAYGAVAGVMQINFVAPAQNTQNVHLGVNGNYVYFDVYVR
jgi:uncharacterized protein (TIGR03437 family)